MKLSRAQATTLQTVIDNGGEMNGYSGQKGFYVPSLGNLVKRGLLEDLGTTRDDDGNFLTYCRKAITQAGRDALAAHQA
jgi:hypothetical protein